MSSDINIERALLATLSRIDQTLESINERQGSRAPSIFSFALPNQNLPTFHFPINAPARAPGSPLTPVSPQPQANVPTPQQPIPIGGLGLQQLAHAAGGGNQPPRNNPPNALPANQPNQGGGPAPNIGQIVAGLPGPVGVAAGMVGGVVGFGIAIANSVNALRRWDNTLLHMNFQFAEFSASMAGVAARQRAFDINLSRERGDRLAPSANILAQARNRLETTAAPIEDTFTRARNIFTAALSLVLEDFLRKYIAPISKDVAKILDYYDKLSQANKGADIQAIDTLLNDINLQRDQWRDYGVPKNMRP